MSLFSEIESTIERGFRRFTERVFGPAESDELLLVHHGILEDVETKIQTLARGRRVFPYSSVTVTLVAPQADRRALLQAAFAEGGRLESDIREALEGAGCEVPRAFAVEVRTAHVKPLADVRADIEKTLRAEEQTRLQKQWIETLRNKTFVTYF